MQITQCDMQITHRDMQITDWRWGNDAGLVLTFVRKFLQVQVFARLQKNVLGQKNLATFNLVTRVTITNVYTRNFQAPCHQGHVENVLGNLPPSRVSECSQEQV